MRHLAGSANGSKRIVSDALNSWPAAKSLGLFGRRAHPDAAATGFVTPVPLRHAALR